MCRHKCCFDFAKYLCALFLHSHNLESFYSPKHVYFRTCGGKCHWFYALGDNWSVSENVCLFILPRSSLKHINPDSKIHGPTWGPPGSCRPQMSPCWPHEPCYQVSQHYPLWRHAVPFHGYSKPSGNLHRAIVGIIISYLTGLSTHFFAKNDRNTINVDF